MRTMNLKSKSLDLCDNRKFFSSQPPKYSEGLQRS